MIDTTEGKQKQKPASNIPPQVIFRTCDLFVDSIKKYPYVYEKVKAFKDSKTLAPMGQFGGSDSFFTKNSPFGVLSKLAHAHLTQDLSLVYTLSGADPKYFYLYGIFSHSELGTSWTPDVNAQKRMVKKFKNQDFS